ncbi:hypothetical protein RWV98_17695 [Agathobaculum sp. NTUH-O15-33]|uniref:hypothetical protein n=1 Tax=Agathobaculum sp. NTUH-O15-33 TaxID=3079302 RepID=UPI00295841D7|nr:hypothetical protein [Agathobaculum sp. NTUH-O15-33]WNX84384.1 hypothetical protein RWV98_17695 [Agathobaculum sp. NTUH-O15-33]
MNPLFDISVAIHYRIHNSDWFGGAESVGYTKQTFGHVRAVEETDDAFLDKQRTATAELFGIQSDDVEVIPWKEYEKETAEEGETDETDI